LRIGPRRLLAQSLLQNTRVGVGRVQIELDALSHRAGDRGEGCMWWGRVEWGDRGKIDLKAL